MTGRPDQLSTSSAIKLSQHESLVESRFAERCDKLMIVDTSASFAACAKYGRMDQARLDGPTKVSRIDTFHCSFKSLRNYKMNDSDGFFGVVDLVCARSLPKVNLAIRAGRPILRNSKA
jgi:hypothetical protein